MEVRRYLSATNIADHFNVAPSTVSKWRTRYAQTGHPCPEPDVWIGDTPGWENLDTWKAWKVVLPGQGTRDAGRLPMARAQGELSTARHAAEQQHPGSRHNDKRAFLAVAAQYGVDKDTTMAVWARMADEYDELPVDELDERAIAHIIRGRKGTVEASGEQPQSSPAGPQ